MTSRHGQSSSLRQQRQQRQRPPFTSSSPSPHHPTRRARLSADRTPLRRSFSERRTHIEATTAASQFAHCHWTELHLWIPRAPIRDVDTGYQRLPREANIHREERRMSTHTRLKRLLMDAHFDCRSRTGLSADSLVFTSTLQKSAQCPHISDQTRLN